MAKIERKTQKIFASNTSADQITAFGTAKTTSPEFTTDVAEIQTNTFLQGWSQSLVSDLAPFMQDSNGLWYMATKQLAYLFQEGIAEWDAETEYSIGSLVKTVSNNTCNFYQSIKNSNINNAVTDTSYWKEVFNVTSTYSATGTVAVNGTAVASAINSAVSNRLKTDHSNDTKPYLKTTYVSGTSGYNIWSNGYCEQWGRTPANAGSYTVTLAKKYNNKNFNAIGVQGSTNISGTGGSDGAIIFISDTNKIYIDQRWQNTRFTFWKTSGYLASGQY